MTLKQYSNVTIPNDDSAAAGRADRAPSVFGKFADGLNASLMRSFKTSEPVIAVVCLLGFVGMPFYYLIWQYLFPQHYENLELRLLGSFLCALTCSYRWWPPAYQHTLAPVVWYTTITYSLPFFFTFMLLANAGSPVWLVTWLLGFILLAMVVEFAGLVVLLTVGVALATLLYFERGGELLALTRLIEQIPVFLFTVIAGTVSMYRQQVARETLTRARDAAEAANRAKSEFLAMMSHEIRTPMNGVLGMAGILMETPLTPEQRRCVGTIRQSGEGLLHIINDVLDFSKLEAESMELEEIPFDLYSVLSYAAEIVTPRANARGLKLNVVIPESVPKFVRTDAGRLRQVVLNLLGNAVKFTERGHVDLVVSVSETPDAMLRVEVRDTGIGISSENLPKLFNSFTQADASITRRFGGSGLGLAISKKLVVRMGGSVGVESELGRGSTFWFEVPIQRATESDVNALSMHGIEGAYSESLRQLKELGRPLRVLVAEDNATNQIVVKAVLAKFGITPDLAGNGAEAVEALRHSRYDAVFMDVHMPEMDGLEATRAIRMLKAPSAATPIIALTANALANDIEQCRVAGMNAYVSKPFRTEELVIALATAVRGLEMPAVPAGQSERDETAGEAPVVNWSTIETFEAALSRDTLQDLLGTYLTDTASKLEELRALASTSPVSRDVVRLVHSFKSSSAQAGAQALAEMAAALENEIRAGRAACRVADVDEMSRLFAGYREAVIERGLAV